MLGIDFPLTCQKGHWEMQNQIGNSPLTTVKILWPAYLSSTRSLVVFFLAMMSILISISLFNGMHSL